MSTAHLALKYHRPQGVTGDPLRVATDLASNRSTTSVVYFTGWAVKFGIGAQLLSETHPLSAAP